MVDKPLTKLTKDEKNTQNKKLKIKMEIVTADPNKFQRKIREYMESLYSNKLENIDKINQFLDICSLIKLNQDYINFLIQLKAMLEVIMKHFPTKKCKTDSLLRSTNLLRMTC